MNIFLRKKRLIISLDGGLSFQVKGMDELGNRTVNA